MIQKGTIFKTKTRTVNDVFGEVVWEIAEDGMKAPEVERVGMMDGVKCVMLCGTGTSARAGYIVYDSVAQIEADNASGIKRIVSLDQVE